MFSESKGVAIKYNKLAPKIVAIARGKLLEKLLEIAKRYNITIYRDADLAEILSKLKVGSDIPEDLFKAVSEVMAFCYRINSEFRLKVIKEKI